MSQNFQLTIPIIPLVIFDILLFIIGIGLLATIVLEIRQLLGRKRENIYTSNSDLSQEETKRVPAVRSIK